MQQAIFSTRSLEESLWRYVGGMPEVLCVDVGSTVAAKLGADAPGGGISLRFCRRGCAAPAFKAATLNVLPRSTSYHAQRPGATSAIKKEDDIG